MKQRLTNWNAKDTEKSRQKALELCENARGQLVLHYPFVGHLGLQIEFVPVVDSRIRTIATNGKVIYIRPEWIIQLPMVTRAAIIAHTIWTAALCHSFRRGELDARRFDHASDLEVYSLLKAEKVSMTIKPDYADRFPKHLTVEEIFKALPENTVERSEDADVHLYLAGRVALPSLAEQALEEERKKQQEQMPIEKHSSSKQLQTQEQRGERKDGQKENAEEQQGNGDDGATQPDQDAAANREGNSGDGEESSGGAEENHSGDDGGHSETAPAGECSQSRQAENRKTGKVSKGETRSTLENAEEDVEHDPAVDTECDPMMREVWRQRILETAQAYEMMHGTLPGDIAEVVQQFRESRIDYMQKLRRYLTLHSGGETKWLPPAKRFVWQKMYLPSHNNGRLEAVLAIDTSGSTQDYLDKFFGDTLKIMRQFVKFHLTVILCDAEVTEVKEYTENSRVPKEIVVKGGGGTNFIPVFKYIESKHLSPRVMLYLTDGVGDAPKKAPDYPVIWVLTPHGKKPCDWGEVIQMDNNETLDDVS